MSPIHGHDHDGLLHRRDVVCGGGAAMFGTLLAALLGDAAPVGAEPVAGAVPEVDRLAVRVVIDSYQLAVAPSTRVGDVAIERFGWDLGEGPPGRTLISEFGLSMHAESRRGDEVRRVLVDYGFTPQALINNVELLDIAPEALDALVLSHGHYDHFGGLAGFLRQNGGRLRAKLPFYVGGEECFCAREWTAPPRAGDFGALDRQALEEADVVVTFAEGPALVADHAFTTGQVPATTFEKVLSPSRMKVGIEHGHGCYADRLPEDERSQAVIPDQFRHEIATVYNLAGKGLVVLTSCSHRGVLNIVRQARAVSGVQKVHAVLGGFHLAPYQDDYVREVVAGLKGMDVGYVVPMHCTGEPFYDIARTEMPGRVLRSHTGTRFVFGA
ncbi:MBL fold metallo-hydrolase [Benzoatithermus flavus]|uniref:MBL fold metallo-hydrolase n=1 Tax=Benzoatithermus flavus TaxID=3108223 RepID=A0ABU8XSN7_9PROT